MKFSPSMILFLLIASAILGLIHWFFWRRLVKPIQAPRPLRIAVGCFLVLACLSLPLGMVFMRVLPLPWRTWHAWPTFIWMGMMSVILILLLILDLGRLGHWLFRHLRPATSPVDPSRRLFLSRMTSAAVVAVTAATTGVAAQSALAMPRVRRVRVILPNLPPSFDGFTLAQITDLHVGETIQRPFVQRVVERINSLQADLVAVTGDLVDGSVERLREHVEPLGGLRSRLGTFFVTGNHDYYSGVVPWMEEVSRLGMRVLRNERIPIMRGAEFIELAGVDDSGTGRSAYPKGHGADVAKALSKLTPGRTVILLAHQPKEVEAAARHGASLVLSGHTHGGQLWPFRAMVLLAQPYIDGLHLHREKTWIYVSRGTGFWGPPLRLACPSEITHIELRRQGEPKVEWET